MEIDTKLLYPIQASTEQWTDGRVIEAVDLETLLLFVLYVPNVLSQAGLRYKGHILRQKHEQVLMTIKAIENGTPLVVFITADTTISCMHRFLSLLEDDRLSWVRDRYPWI